MGEPFASFGDLDQVGLPTSWLAMAARAEAAEVRAEQRAEAERRAELEDRQEARQHRWLTEQYRMAVAEGREGIDVARPETFCLSPDEIADRVFREQDRQTRRDAFRADVREGRVTVLNISPSDMAPAAAAEAEELADGWAGRMKERTQHAGIVARVKRWRMRSQP
jgi:hypothetical protein